MKIRKNKSKRSVKRGERHGYLTEGKMRKEVILSKQTKKEIMEEL